MYALALYGEQIIAGGEFTRSGGVTLRNLARWNGSAWESYQNGVNGPVTELEVDGGYLYLGGRFTTVGPEQLQIAAPAGLARLISVGPSTAWGFCLRTPIIPTRL